MSAFVHVRVHFIWSTFNRAATIQPAWRDNLYAYFSGICDKVGCKLLIAGGMPDHVHLYVSMGVEQSIAQLVNVLKSNSSRWVHENHDRAFQWQTKYAAFSLSRSVEDHLFDYIRRQEVHHRRKSYQEEVIEFLERHQMEYDPRYVFE